MKKRWAKAPHDRDQLMLLSPSLDEMLGGDHEIRLLDALLLSLDWSGWEERYDSSSGQPPIHPRLMAGCILYGLTLGIRSLRGLEDATRHRTDFIWFLSGQTIDHSTFWQFQHRFEGQLKELSRELKRRGQAQLGCNATNIAVDGTFIRANSDRHGCRTAASLVKELVKLESNIDELLGELSAPDADDLHGQLARLEAEKAKVLAALEVAQSRDAKKRKHSGRSARATRVPVTDPDAHLIKDKFGGQTPNYGATVAVDVDSGLIVDSAVLDGMAEAEALPRVVDECVASLGQAPTAILADSNFSDGQVLKQLNDRGVAAYIPQQRKKIDKITLEQILSGPLPPELLERLPRNGGRFSRSCFTYDPTTDSYYCPQGRQLSRYRTVRVHRTPHIRRAEYRTNCAGCPLRSDCIKDNANNRIVTRDPYTPYRDASTQRLSTDEGRRRYKLRAPVAEGTIGVIKNVMNVRQFHCRGRERVRTEWLWVCTAFNLRKILKAMAAERTQPPIRGKNVVKTAIWRLLSSFAVNRSSQSEPTTKVNVTTYAALTAA
jgi:transposase